VAAALTDAPADAASRTARTRAGRPRGLTVRASADERDVITVRAVGNLDIYTASQLRQRLSRHDPASGRVVLDVSAVTLVDSAGLGTLMSFANRARQGGSRLTLISTPQLAELLEIARLTDAFDLRVVREE
jgi:anti-sigma B factor antagonist